MVSSLVYSDERFSCLASVQFSFTENVDMATPKQMFSRPAYSLMDLLITVAIICLLLALLLPSVSRAREQAKSVVCLVNLKNLVNAATTYHVEYRGYLPGSPLTSGLPLAVADLANRGVWQPGLPLNIFDLTVPLLRQLSIPAPAGTSAANWYPISTDGVFHCPANKERAVSWPVDNGVVINAPSYLSMNTLMRGGPDAFLFWMDDQNKARLAVSRPAGDLTGGEAAKPQDMGQSPVWDMLVPNRYVPRMESLGNTSLKIFIADGIRFFRPPMTIDYNIRTTGFAGYYSAQPPCDILATPPNAAREYNLARKYSYRHRGGTAINAAMFDGHVETLQARFTGTHWKGYANRGQGSALHPQHYFPSRTRVQDNTNLFRKDDVQIGTILP